MWHLTACKISVSLSFLKWNNFYCISELMLPTLMQRYDKKIISFLIQFRGKLKFYRLSDAAFYERINTIYQFIKWGWSGGAKVLCILHHRGVQLILAYSWARPAILVVGKGRGGMFLFLLFLHFHSCSSFFPVPLFHLWPSRVDVSLNPNTINQSINLLNLSWIRNVYFWGISSL